MSEHIEQKYLALSNPLYRNPQQHGEKIFADQSDDELVIHVFQTNWLGFFRTYMIIGVFWAMWILSIIIILSLDLSSQNKLLTIIGILMGVIVFDTFIMLKILNENLNCLILTSKRMVSQSFSGVFGKSSDSVNFDNLNDAMHIQEGIVASKFGKSGTVILKLASGEERSFTHIPSPAQAVNVISQIQELYINEGKSASFGYLFSLNNKVRSTKQKVIQIFSTK